MSITGAFKQPAGPDPKAERIRAAAEQKRLDQQAAIQAGRAQLALDEERKAAQERARMRRQQQRRNATAKRADRVRTLLPTIGRRVLIVGPITAPMAVAWVGQIQFAKDTLKWLLLGAIVFAAAWELTTAFAGWMYHQARQAGDAGTVYRAATWIFASSAGAMNYWHALDGAKVTDPTPKAVSYGAMSLVGIALWELYASLVHRQALRAEGKLPPARPKFGVARWVRYPRITFTAWSLAIRDGLDTTEQAWAAATGKPAAARIIRWDTTFPGPRAYVNLSPTRPGSVANSDGAPVASSPEAGANTAPPAGASSTANWRRNDPEPSDSSNPALGDSSAAKSPTTQRQKTTRTGGRSAAKKAPRRSMTEWVELAGPVFHAQMNELRRQPTATEFAEAIKKAGLGTVSASTAKNIRTEILDREPVPALDDLSEGERQ
jgi:hypothetical protein